MDGFQLLPQVVLTLVPVNLVANAVFDPTL
jgi:hypothetical protein